ncbi:hypothetical protein [Sphingobacterium suaedae]|uniref:DUF4968 domain-containing protein n=1 Tax=Sphingobacterium suaedae TaxID=1686402 RepID=A0ABW5KP15_9SPHI
MLIVRMLVLFAASITWMSAGLVYGQDRIRFTINLHGMDKEKLVVHFDDGVVLNVLDLSQTDSVLLVDQPIYTPYPALFAIYDGKSSDKYLIEKDGAVLNLFYDASRSKTPVYSNNNTRVRAIDDTVSNSLY